MRTKRGLLLLTALLAFCATWLTARAAPEKTEPFVPADATLADHILFRAGENEAAVYRFGGHLAKPIFWPLKASDNQEVTRPWPMRSDGLVQSRDHKHQKSAWFTYGDVIPEGMKIKHKKGVEGIDFWAEEPGCGRIVCVRAGDYQNQRNHASVTTFNEWRTADGDKIMEEVRRIQFFNYTTARLFIVDSDLHASVVPITFGDTKEGAFGVRVADSMREKGGKGRLTNADGKVGMIGCWGRISAWCDYSGLVEGLQTSGIAIFAGPDNSVPTCWHSRDYGLMAANPFGRAKSGFPAMKDKKDKKDLVHLDKGEHLKLRYGLFVHQGDVKQGKVAEAYEMFKKMK